MGASSNGLIIIRPSPPQCSLEREPVDYGSHLSETVFRGSTRLASEDKPRIQVLQGTLDLIVLRTLASMGPQHAYGIASRLEQVSEDLLKLNQGTLYPALVRLEQQGWIKGKWDKTENGREAKFYAITKAGTKALGEETQRWKQMSGLVEKLLGGES
jgi:PadR family transcriptional regulator, regulatory protein PadR